MRCYGTCIFTYMQRHQLFEKQSSKNCCCIKFSIPEVKILIFSCYFIIFGIIALVTLSIFIRDSEILTDKLLTFVVCESKGYTDVDSCVEERDNLYSHTHSDLTSATYILLALIPWSSLLFAVQVADIRRAVHKIISLYQNHRSQEKSLSTVSNNVTS